MSDRTMIEGPFGGLVESKNKHLLVQAAMQTEFEHISEDDSLSFSWSIVAADFSAAETLLLVQNDSDDKVLHISAVSFSTDNASEFDIHLTNGAVLSPTGGTLVTGVCLNQSAVKVAEAIARSNETGNVQGNIIWSNRIAANVEKFIPFGGAVILRKGQSIAVDITTAPTSFANCNIYGYYDEA